MYGTDSPTSTRAAPSTNDPPPDSRALEIRREWDAVEAKAKAFARDFCMLEDGSLVRREYLLPGHPLRRADTRPSFLVRLFRRFF